MILKAVFTICLISILAGCGDSEPSGESSNEANKDIVVNEILVKSSGTGNSDWIELYNKGGGDADISNWSIRDSKDRDLFIIPAGTIVKSGGFFVVSFDESGENGFKFGLGNEDAVRLLDSAATVINSVQWTDGDIPEDQSYGRVPDGASDFKVLVSPTKGTVNIDTCGNGILDAAEACDGHELGSKSCEELFFKSGTLGCSESCGFDTSSCAPFERVVVINEVAAKVVDVDGTTELPDWVELYSPGVESDISGWVIKDKRDSNSYTFPEGTTVGVDAYFVVDQETVGFGFGSSDSVRLFDKSGASVDQTSWDDGQAPENKSWARVPNGIGEFQAVDAPTKGENNE